MKSNIKKLLLDVVKARTLECKHAIKLNQKQRNDIFNDLKYRLEAKLISEQDLKEYLKEPNKTQDLV